MRIQVNLANGMVDRIDKYAELMGVSRSALCATLIGQGIMSYDKATEIVKNIQDKATDTLDKLAE